MISPFDGLQRTLEQDVGTLGLDPVCWCCYQYLLHRCQGFEVISKP